LPGDMPLTVLQIPGDRSRLIVSPAGCDRVSSYEVSLMPNDWVIFRQDLGSCWFDADCAAASRISEYELGNRPIPKDLLAKVKRVVEEVEQEAETEGIAAR
jgi:hypothetical protein